jgi:N-acetylglucosamine-6-phosphate deacetylase
MLTLAPELEGAAQLAQMSSERGVVVCAGHSNAAFELAYEAFDGEVAGVTHLFNAMSPLHHRKPGLPGAAFAHPRATCSIITDGRHVHPEMINLAFRMLGPDRLYLVTDATSATGAGSGEYRLASQRIHLDADGAPTLESGEFAGSVFTMDEALRNALTFADCNIPEAIRMASTTPARLIGEGERMGRLASGYDADIAVLRPDLSVEAVYKGGLRAHLTQAHGGVHDR